MRTHSINHALLPGRIVRRTTGVGDAFPRRRGPAGRMGTAIMAALFLLGAFPAVAPAASGLDPSSASLVSAAGVVAATDAATEVTPAAAQAPGVVSGVTPAALTVSLHTVVGGLRSPVAIAAPNDGSGRLFVVEQAGRIRIIKGNTLLATPYLDLRSKVSCCGERGLLGLAFHPQFATNHRFFVYYTNRSGNIQVSEFRQSSTNSNRAVTTERKILSIGHTTYANHNGGQLAFGPDGFLYIGVGDGGGAGNPLHSGQSRKTLLGKILRININGSSGSRHYLIPSTNPYATSTVYKREIWAFGLRNPWRFSFDRSTGDLWIGDVGQDRYEEVDRALRSAGGGRGRNYGWNVMEGNVCYSPSSGCSTSGKTRPVAVYAHTAGSCSITGGYVYRGTKYAAMRGKYFLADYCSGKIWSLNASSAVGSLRLVADVSFAISSWGQGPTGELYVADYTNGRILHLQAP